MLKAAGSFSKEMKLDDQQLELQDRVISALTCDFCGEMITSVADDQILASSAIEAGWRWEKACAVPHVQEERNELHKSLRHGHVEMTGIPDAVIEDVIDENPDLCFCSDENGPCYSDLTQYLEQRAKEFEAVTV
jgi:hypothetical protein